jgi:hypothetical protein
MSNDYLAFFVRFMSAELRRLDFGAKFHTKFPPPGAQNMSRYPTDMRRALEIAIWESVEPLSAVERSLLALAAAYAAKRWLAFTEDGWRALLIGQGKRGCSSPTEYQVTLNCKSSKYFPSR